MSKDTLNKKRKGGILVCIWSTTPSILFFFLHGLQVQGSIWGRKFTIYFYQDMQAFWWANYNFAQLVKWKLSSNIIWQIPSGKENGVCGSYVLRVHSATVISIIKPKTYRDTEEDSSAGRPVTNCIYSRLEAPRSWSPASAALLTDDKECIISMATHLSFMEWKIFDGK